MVFTVALVGPDGAGKTTVAKMLMTSFPLPIKYLYMGTAIQSSNHSLPTSRLIQRIKERRHRKILEASGEVVPEKIATHELASRKPKRNVFEQTIGLLNTLAEEWYRQIIALIYDLSGYVVLCDRHFLFEHLPHSESFRRQNESLSMRIHMWVLRYFYPQPDLVILLDAPPALLMSRKNEWSLDHLSRQREGILEQGERSRHFERVDATRALEAVVADVKARIVKFHETGTRSN
jgi:thymidylate kinase